MTWLIAVLGVAGTLLGVVIGGVMTFLISRGQQRHQRRLEIERRQLEHLEEIHEQLSHAYAQASALNVQLMAKLSVDSRIDAKEIAGKFSLDRLQMLVDFYAPALKPEVESLVTHWTVLVRAVAKAIGVIGPSDDWRKETMTTAIGALAGVKRAVDSAKSELTALVKPYVDEK